ncbi:hypothetical protein ACFL28_05515, partial [Candidatus Omnitrophota bacterium]
GEDDGVEIGDSLIVHRDAEGVAKAYIIEVREEVSAAEIISVEMDEEIWEGDDVLIVREIEEPQKKPKKKDKKPKWTVLLGKASKPLTKTGVEIVSEEDPGYIDRRQIAGKGDLIAIDIYHTPKAVFTYASTVLRESGFTIISSNRATGILSAVRPIELSLLKELWADAFAAIDHNLLVSLEVKRGEGSSRLIVASFKEHSQKGRYVKRAIVKDSKYHNELIKLVSEIKERSEY